MAQNFATNLLAFILVLGFLIFAHEAGHFIVAKLFRVRVLVFSFGFGKRLFGFRKGDTDYRVSLIPLGGYVRMAGDNPEENVAGESGRVPLQAEVAALPDPLRRPVDEHRHRHRVHGRRWRWSAPSSS